MVDLCVSGSLRSQNPADVVSHTETRPRYATILPISKTLQVLFLDHFRL